MTDDTPLPFDLPAVRRKKLTVDFSGGTQSSDAGLLLMREAERQLGVCRRLADAMPDDRDQARVRHQMFELVMARSSAIACGHKDGSPGLDPGSRPAAPRPTDEARCRPLSRERCGPRVAIDLQPAGECAAQGRGRAARRRAGRSVRRDSEARQGGGHRHRRHLLRGASWRSHASHGRGQQLAFWNAHQDERGFATMHVYHVNSGTPLAAILRPGRTPKGTEVRTVVKHVTERLRRHWAKSKTRIVWRGDSHYGRDEAMEWCEDNGEAFIFGLPGNSVLDAYVQETADHLRFWHAIGTEEKLRCYTSHEYRARSWARARRVIARIECSLQPDPKEPGYYRQEVDIRYVVTSLEGSPEHLYENVYCQRGQMENLIKLHKAQLASDRMSCHAATANQVRLVLHTAAFWLMHGVRSAIPATAKLATAEFQTIRERLVKIAARVIEHAARVRIVLPSSCPDGALFRAVALGLMASGP